MRDLGLTSKVLALHDAFTDAHIAHAIGGAIALAYYGEPRATADIDVNVFVPETEGESVLRVVGGLGAAVQTALRDVLRDGQCRVMWGQTPVDLFFATLPFNQAMARAVRIVPLAGRDIPILAAEHLIVCKALFNRPKDWPDIAQMLLGVPDLRVAEIRSWMNQLVGADDGRAQRLETLIAEYLGDV